MKRLLMLVFLVFRFHLLAAHSCSHSHHSHSTPVEDHHSHSHSSHHHHHHQDDHRKSLLPEELAEEEDLRLYGFGSETLPEPKLSTLELWGYAMGCSLLVSMASLVCLIILPFIVSKPSTGFVNALAAFGAGAMMGDAFLHQLPHAFGRSGHSHTHEHGHEQEHAHSFEDLSIGISVLAGIILFFIVEKIVRYVEQYGLATGHHHHHHKHHSYEHKKDDTVTENSDKPDLDKLSQSETKKAIAEVVEPQPSRLVLGYLNLFSDGVHNFTDGMALGAAFLVHGTTGGLSRTFFLLVHELPQEIGDFGILVGSGFTVFKALAFNFLSALVALVGTALALLLGADPGQSSLIEGFTAGGFLYISLAGVLPEMHQQGNSVKTSLTQLAALCGGIAVAIAISMSE